MSEGVKLALVLTTLFLAMATPIAIGVCSQRRFRKKRARQIAAFKGIAQGTIQKIVDKDCDRPIYIYASYKVGGVEYQLKEAARWKVQTLKLGWLPVGTRQTLGLGNIHVGDTVEIHYSKEDPQDAFIYGNDGSRTA